jgi:hypothetical protein
VLEETEELVFKGAMHVAWDSVMGPSLSFTRCRVLEMDGVMGVWRLVYDTTSLYNFQMVRGWEMMSPSYSKNVEKNRKGKVRT